MSPEQAAALRAPFPPEQVGKLPRTTCKACSDSREKVCAQHNKSKCNGCGNYMTTAHIHLDFVSHAAVTDRLLKVDPEWTWEPMGTDPQTGVPVVDHHVGLWIRLTVAGVTRIGYGDAEGKKGGDAVKEAISTAIRNAAMRFGVALDLWSKTDLWASPEPEGQTHGRGEPPEGDIHDDLRAQIRERAAEEGRSLADVRDGFESAYGEDIREASEANLRAFLAAEWVVPGSKPDAPHPGESGTPRTGDPHGTFGTNRGAVHEPANEAVANETVATGKTPDDFREALMNCATKAEVKAVLRDVGMAQQGDVEVGDEQGEPVTLTTLATRLMKALPA